MRYLGIYMHKDLLYPLFELSETREQPYAKAGDREGRSIL